MTSAQKIHQELAQMGGMQMSESSQSPYPDLIYTECIH